MSMLVWVGDLLLVTLASFLGVIALVSPASPFSQARSVLWNRCARVRILFSSRLAAMPRLWTSLTAPSPVFEVWMCAEWLDTVSTALEAGIGLLQAHRIATSLLPPSSVRDDFARTEEAFLLGASVSEALAFAKAQARTPSVRKALGALERSHSLGSPAADALIDIRTTLETDLAAFQQEKIARLPVHMLFPLALFVLPALLMLVCAPLLAEFASLVLGP